MADIFDLFRQIEQKPAPSPAKITHLVVGLGNPGREYAHTRHNAGFDALTHLADSLSVKIDRLRHKARVAEAVIGGVRALLMMPETFMNLSGEAVSDAASFYHIPPENILILCDDISFEPGRVRIRRSGSHGGHNGLRNIIDRLGGNTFPRIKIGVGKKPEGWELVDFVLGHPTESERKAIVDRHPDIADAVAMILSGDIEGAMCKYSK